MALKSWREDRNPYPIWGTCLGFELLALFANNDEPYLSRCWSQDQALPLNFTSDWPESDLGKSAGDDMTEILANKDVTVNFHRWCLTPQNFTQYHMENFWKSLATGMDPDNLGEQ